MCKGKKGGRDWDLVNLKLKRLLCYDSLQFSWINAYNENSIYLIILGLSAVLSPGRPDFISAYPLRTRRIARYGVGCSLNLLHSGLCSPFILREYTGARLHSCVVA